MTQAAELPDNVESLRAVTDDGDDGDYEVLTIHEAMGRILSELPSIGKGQWNDQQKFAFRGLDDVLNALNPLLAKYGVFYLPDVVERTESVRLTGSGKNMYVVNLHVRYRFYGPEGDYVEASGWGEGTDMGDKATPKAMTGAMKYVLNQAFAIATDEQTANDADAGAPEETEPPPPLVPAAEDDVIRVRDALVEWVAEHDGVYPESWKERRYPKVETFAAILTLERPWPAEVEVAAFDLCLANERLAEDEAEIAATPCAVCESTRTERVRVDGIIRCARRNDCEKRAMANVAHDEETEGDSGE